jgi:toxin ParE1/3/4
MPKPDHKLIWSPTAERDLVEIWSYLDRHASRNVADSQIRKIEARCAKLGMNPLIGRMRSDLLPELRQVLVNPYIVFYRLNKSDIEILHVLHGRRDLPAVFTDES